MPNNYTEKTHAPQSEHTLLHQEHKNKKSHAAPSRERNLYIIKRECEQLADLQKVRSSVPRVNLEKLRDLCTNIIHDYVKSEPAGNIFVKYHDIVQLTAEIRKAQVHCCNQNLLGAYQTLKDKDEKYKNLFTDISKQIELSINQNGQTKYRNYEKHKCEWSYEHQLNSVRIYNGRYKGNLPETYQKSYNLYFLLRTIQKLNPLSTSDIYILRQIINTVIKAEVNLLFLANYKYYMTSLFLHLPYKTLTDALDKCSYE